MESKFRVYIYNGRDYEEIVTFPTEREAIGFCQYYNWVWMDEDQFTWNLDYEEVEA